MTSAFLPSHHTVPVTPGTDAAISESQQEMVGTTHMEAQGEMPDTAKHSKPTPIRVLVVDDHEIVRKGLCTMLEEQDDFEVVGQASSGNLAVTLAKQLHRACPKTRVVILTGLTDEGHLFRAMRIGVHGYLQKALPIDELLTALRAVQQGERVIGEPRAVTQVLGEFERLTKEQERVRSGLSDLEIELVRLAAAGCSNKEIASRQFWSEVTVKRKMQDIYRKLQVTDRAQAVAEAMRMGLI